MQKITFGRLRILTFSRIYEFPAPSDQPSGPDNLSSDQPSAELRVVRDVFWLRLLTMGDLGFSEAYMFGDVECDDLVALFQVLSASPMIELPLTPCVARYSSRIGKTSQT
jgi:cyclopropane-fatty-acyl-phospholipid synthase